MTQASYKVDFTTVSTIGLESSPVSQKLAGLRANEARYFMNKYQVSFTVAPASQSHQTISYVENILKTEKNIVIAAKPLETAQFETDGIKWTYVFYQDGLVVNVLYSLDKTQKRAVGFKLSDGMEIPKELASKFKFATMKSKLAGSIRGSYFIIKGEY